MARSLSCPRASLAIFFVGLAVTLLGSLLLEKQLPHFKHQLSPPQNEIHLIVQWFFSPIQARHLEFVESLKRNVLNPEIARIHFLQSGQGHNGRPWSLESFQSLKEDPGFPFDLFRRKLVVSSHDFEDRLPMSVVFEYASQRLRKQLCIFANLDIFFDESLALLKDPAIDLNYMNYYFLSRYEFRGEGTQMDVDEGEEQLSEVSPEEDQDFMRMREVMTPEGMVIQHRGLRDQCGPHFIGSHDTIIFVPPLPSELIKRCDVRVGSWGIENRLMWEFERFGIKVRNPCLDIKSWHIHRSLLKTGWTPLVNSENRSSVAHPQKLFPSPFVRLRVDLKHDLITPATIVDGMVVMLRNEHSVRCLFSRSDAKFGHARCTEDYVDQHWVIKATTETGSAAAAAAAAAAQPPRGGLPSGLGQLSKPFILQGRESQLCMVAKDLWVGHQACIPNLGSEGQHLGEGQDKLLWRLAAFENKGRTLQPEMLLIHEASGLCVFSSITDNLGMVPCERVGDEMVWKVDRLLEMSF